MMIEVKRKDLVGFYIGKVFVCFWCKDKRAWWLPFVPIIVGMVKIVS